MQTTSGYGYPGYEGGYGNGSAGGYGGFGDPAMTEKIEHILWLTRTLLLSFYPPLLVLGVVGNTLVLAIMSRKARASSTYTYLLALSVADSAYLCSSVLVWVVFSATTGRGDLRRQLDCNLVYLMTYFPREVSAWLLVAVSVERALVVYLPTKARAVCDVIRARVVIGVIVTLDLLANWVYFGGLKTNRKPPIGFIDDACAGRDNVTHDYWETKAPWVSSSLYSYVPALLLFVLNLCIIVKFVAAARASRAAVGASDDTGGSSSSKGGTSNTAGRTMARYSRRMTVMGLALSGTFLALTLPQAASHIYYTLHQAAIQRDVVRYYNYFMMSQLLAALNHVNHAINFALYCLASAKFRRDLLVLLRCRRATTDGSTIEYTNTNTNM